jgi:hypothetical protein
MLFFALCVYRYNAMKRTNTQFLAEQARVLCERIKMELDQHLEAEAEGGSRAWDRKRVSGVVCV